MPPLTLENASALVPGGVTTADINEEGRSMQAQQKPAAPATLRGVVARAFYYQGKPTKVGEELTLPRIFALEMEAAKKLRLVQEPVPAPVEEKPSEPVKKESRNAR